MWGISNYSFIFKEDYDYALIIKTYIKIFNGPIQSVQSGIGEIYPSFHVNQ